MMYGFLNVNKSKGNTSFDVIRDLRRILGIKKIGHAGTLDPLASGVLVIAIGEATKLIEYIMKTDKEYEADIVFGKTSNTYDADGEIEEMSNQKPALDVIEDVLKGFIGEIDQVPPIFSALKIDGERAYVKARKGEEVKMKSRKVTINDIELLEYKYPILKIRVKCGSGTYIRSLAHDIGQKLKTGAYLTRLERIKVGDYVLEDSVTTEEIKEKGVEDFLISLESASLSLKRININEEEYEKLAFGQAIIKPEFEDGLEIAAAFLDNKLVGILEPLPNSHDGLIKFHKKLNL